MKHIKTSFYVVAALLVSSCTVVKVSKVVSGKENGVQYALGKPLLKVVPDPAGTGAYSVELIYVPDQNQVYAVHSKAIMKKNTMSVEVDDAGIIKKIDWKGESDTGASQLLGSASEIAKARLEDKKKDSDKTAEDAKKKKDDAEKNVQDIQDKLDSKSLDLAKLNAEIGWLTKTYPKPDADVVKQLRDDQLEKVSLEVEISELNKSMINAKKSVEDAANAPTGAETAWGPLFFEIKDTYNPYAKNGAGGTVLLTALKVFDKTGQSQKVGQGEFETISKYEEKPIVKCDAPKLNVIGVTAVHFAVGARPEKDFMFDKKIESVDEEQYTLVSSGTPLAIPNAALTFKVTDNQKLTVNFKEKLLVGSYKLVLPVTYKCDEAIRQTSVTISLNVQ